MGTISVSRRQRPMDMRQELAAKAEKKAPAATVLLKPVPAIAGTLPLSCTNKPSSSYPTTCPRLSGAFLCLPALNRSSLPALLPLHQTQYQGAKAPTLLIV
jgi:hypothetical protein